jgi:hypothetical protein
MRFFSSSLQPSVSDSWSRVRLLIESHGFAGRSNSGADPAKRSRVPCAATGSPNLSLLRSRNRDGLPEPVLHSNLMVAVGRAIETRGSGYQGFFS